MIRSKAVLARRRQLKLKKMNQPPALPKRPEKRRRLRAPAAPPPGKSVGAGTAVSGVPVPSENIVLFSAAVVETLRPRMRVVTVMRNCVSYVAHCVRSLLQQNIPFRAVIIDDVSTDGTYEVARQTMGYDSRIILMRNDARRGALANIMRGIDILQPEPDDVIVTLDGDDWFSGSDSLDYVQQRYRENPSLRLTYGQFVHSSSGAGGLCAAYPPHIAEARAYRRHSWLASHLRTFRAELWRKVRRESLIDPATGQPWMMAWDMAMMFPMMEMCSARELKFLAKVLYVYNDGNPLNDNKVDARLQQNSDARIRAMSSYSVTSR